MLFDKKRQSFCWVMMAIDVELIACDPPWQKESLLARRHTFTRRVISLMKPAFFGLGFAGRIAMLLTSRVAGRTIDLHGPYLACGAEVARPYLVYTGVYDATETDLRVYAGVL